MESQQRQTLLLVDDEEIIREVGSKMLERMGYAVLTASSGAEALACYQEHRERIALVILDLILPDMSGGDAFDRIRELRAGAKVLLSSGYSADGEAADILKRGCDGFIQKPFNMEALSAAIRELLPPA
ncbi:MAG: response regulator [Desulfobacteraceae bacterium]|nr:response regulator [Desulfobacteraceae bacterium]